LNAPQPPTDELLNEGREIQSVEPGALESIVRGEIDVQIATAKRYPRSIQKFLTEGRQMVALNQSIAEQCIYALIRWDAKKQENVTIAGPSARFGEVILSAWGNARGGARVVSEGKEFVTSQGVFLDLERNTGITYEVQRRITSSSGKRYGADMIGVTANAANSIALRNAILKGIPKAFWEPLYLQARAVVAGDVKTLADRRKAAVEKFAHWGINEQQILAKLGRAGLADVGIDDIVVLVGIATAIADGDTTPEQAFAPPEGPAGNGHSAGAPPPPPPPPPAWDDASFDRWLKGSAQKALNTGGDHEGLVQFAKQKGPLSAEREAAIRALQRQEQAAGGGK